MVDYNNHNCNVYDHIMPCTKISFESRPVSRNPFHNLKLKKQKSNNNFLYWLPFLVNKLLACFGSDPISMDYKRLQEKASYKYWYENFTESVLCTWRIISACNWSLNSKNFVSLKMLNLGTWFSSWILFLIVVFLSIYNFCYDWTKPKSLRQNPIKSDIRSSKFWTIE